MRFVQAKFAAAAALQNKRHAIEDKNAAEEMKTIKANKKFAHDQMAAAVATQQRSMAALKAATNAHIAQTDTTGTTSPGVSRRSSGAPEVGLEGKAREASRQPEKGRVRQHVCRRRRA